MTKGVLALMLRLFGNLQLLPVTHELRHPNIYTTDDSTLSATLTLTWLPCC